MEATSKAGAAGWPKTETHAAIPAKTPGPVRMAKLNLITCLDH
jgi:hypothetical protein